MVLKTTCSWSLLMCWWWICFVDSFSILVFLYVFWKFRMKPHLEGRVLLCFISLSFLFFLSCSPPHTLGAPDPDPGLPRKRVALPGRACLGGGARCNGQDGQWPGSTPGPGSAGGRWWVPVGRASSPLTRIPRGTSRAKVSSAQNSGPAGQSHSGRAGESRWPNAGSSNHFCKRLDSKYFPLCGRWGSL